jgi:CheY-like chemotaxis protein
VNQATGRTVLVVEDQDEVRTLVMRTLADEGYRVLTACDGIEALEVLEADPEVSLVVSDLVMPRMDGFELANHLSKRVPSPLMLFMSGYGDHHTEIQHPYLQKPFAPATLCREVQRLLLPAQNQA